MLLPSPLELASGVVVGRQVPPVRTRPSHRPKGGFPAALEALRDAMVPALRRPPCLVSFSGGLDSSFLLAVSTGLARGSGLPAPIPCTWRISGAPGACEAGWQEQVIASLQLADWVKLYADDDLDLIGPPAQRLLRRHGVLYPANAHLHLPIVEMAARGSVITGAGGDQILSGWRRPPSPSHSRSLRRALRTSAGAVVRRRGVENRFPWLHSRLAQQVQAAHRKEMRGEPKRVERRVAWHATRRDLVMSCASLAALASDNDVHLVNPFVTDGFVTALARAAGPGGPIPRAQLLASIAAGAVPALTYAPRPKARFLEVFFRAPTRDFVSSWDGAGVDAGIVDIASLQALWSKWPIPPPTASLVQEAWLSADRTSVAAPAVPPGPDGRIEVRP